MVSLKQWIVTLIEGDDAKNAASRDVDDEERQLMVKETLNGKRSRWRVRANSLRVEAEGLRKLGYSRRADALEEDARELEELIRSDEDAEKLNGDMTYGLFGREINED